MALNSSTCCCIPREDQQQQPRTRAMKENASAWPVSGVISHSSCEGGGYEYAHHRKASAEEAFKRGGHGTRSLLSRRRRRRPETMSDHHGTMHEASKVVIPRSLGAASLFQWMVVYINHGYAHAKGGGPCWAHSGWIIAEAESQDSI